MAENFPLPGVNAWNSDANPGRFPEIRKTIPNSYELRTISKPIQVVPFAV